MSKKMRKKKFNHFDIMPNDQEQVGNNLEDMTDEQELEYWRKVSKEVGTNIRIQRTGKIAKRENRGRKKRTDQPKIKIEINQKAIKSKAIAFSCAIVLVLAFMFVFMGEDLLPMYFCALYMPIASIVGLIYGILALREMKINSNKIKGRGLTNAVIIANGLFLIIGLILLSIFLYILIFGLRF